MKYRQPTEIETVLLAQLAIATEFKLTRIKELEEQVQRLKREVESAERGVVWWNTASPLDVVEQAEREKKAKQRLADEVEQKDQNAADEASDWKNGFLVHLFWAVGGLVIGLMLCK